ncbi:MAG: membrane protein insertase YidC [Candidatus Sabulitectum sp.]|nr:membrane protein insertase YidC [Candidatus Sabulitectum sp.]
MSDQSRLFLAAVLMLGVLLISWFVTGKGNSPQTADNTVTAQQIEQLSPAVSLEETETEDLQVNADPDSIPAQNDVDVQSPVLPDRTITVIIQGEKTGEPIVVARLSSKGGSVESWLLQNYEDHPDQNLDQLVNLAEESWLVSRVQDGVPLEFEYSGSDTVIVGEQGAAVTFVSGTATKTYTFTRGFYGFTLEKTGLDITSTIEPGSIPVTEVQTTTKGYFSASWYTNSHNKENSEKIEGLEPTGNVAWIAVSNKYFTVILMPETMERADGYIAPGEGGSPLVALDDTRLTVYAGPKSYSVLSSLGRSTTDMIDFGWPIIRWIGKLIFFFLTSALSFVSNWGVRIIILALTLKILLSPLTTKSYVSMQKMQKIQPAMQEIQKKYAKDPKQQQAEMQKLYKEKGVNPIGGCLPMLLQMPVFFAMYRVLANMVELRGAGFLLWINDLSRPEILIQFQTKILGLEGIGLMAVLLGVIMFLQQKLTGSSGAGAAAQQQKMMMYMMPIFMTFLFMRFASGLTLYWLIFNILTLVHQELIKKKLTSDQAEADGTAK